MKKILKTLLLVALFCVAATGAFAQIDIGVSFNVHVAPPALPVYVQPPCPTDGYLWQPGYWAYSADDEDYYWVPGVWIAPPNPGVYWTPPYWGFVGGAYGFHAGYWGPHVGFYGGINYGFGYGGSGFVGGEWAAGGGGFRYNTAVVNVNTTVVHNTYVNNTVINNTTVNNHTSFNGQGGVTATPNAQERAAMNEHHIQPTAEQQSHQQAAMGDKSAFSKVNNGRPAAAAMNRVNGTAFNARGTQAPATPQARQQAIANRAPQANNNQANRPAAGNSNQNAHPQANGQRPQGQNAQPQQNSQQGQPPHNTQPQNNGQAQQQHAQQQPQQHQQPHPQPQQRPQPQHQQPRPQPHPQQRPPEEHHGRP